MNLLEAPWIPVRDAAGRQRWIAPHQLTENIDTCPIVAVDSGRPDFNGSLVQLLIGLVQTAWERSGQDWDRDEAVDAPPTPAQLQVLFAPLAQAFGFDGDGPRFMQDRTLGADDKPVENDIAALLIDTPGEQALKFNTDHFIKRGRVEAICPDCAAAALFTLMTNAPSGGAGHRTSLRGGGPLTTLVVYDPQPAERGKSGPARALWRDIACNVLEADAMHQQCDPRKTDLKFTFPWLGTQAELQPREETQPLDAHPAHMYWAMPRRIRLDFEATEAGHCNLCGRAHERLLTRYLTKNYGLNYKGPWRHPLSPYYQSKQAEAPLPMHPQADGLGYRHWLGWVLGVSGDSKRIVPATVLKAFRATRTTPEYRLWAFGYDMDNMKARCWYDATFPLFELTLRDPSGTDRLHGLLESVLAAAEHAARSLRWAVRDAWFGDGEARGDLSFIDAQFWSVSEEAFFACLRKIDALMKQDAANAIDASTGPRKAWVDTLRRLALNLFDQLAASGDVAAGNPRRLGDAHRLLKNQLGNRLDEVAGLKAPEPKKKPARAAKAATTS